MLCLEFHRSDSPEMDMMTNPVQAELQIPSKFENRQILDLAVQEGSKHAIILFSESLLVVFDLASRTAVFKAKYNDATDNISQLYFVAGRHLEALPPTAQGSHATAPAPSSETTLLGFLLLLETKMVQKDTPKGKKGGEEQVSVSRAKHLRKLHLVQIQQTQVTSRSKIEKRDKIEQIDALCFGDETPKLVDFIRCKNRYGVPNYFAFLLTRERVKAGGALKLITVKMRWAPNEELKQDDNSFDHDDLREESKAAAAGKAQAKDEGRASPAKGGFLSKWKLKFDFVTSLGPKIENFRGDRQKPNYLNVIEAVEDNFGGEGDDFDSGEDHDGNGDGDSGEPSKQAVFYIYTGVGNQSVVFKRKYSELSHAHGDERAQKEQIEEARNLLAQGAAGKKGQKKKAAAGTEHQNYDDYLERMNQEHQRDKEQIKAQLEKQINDAVRDIDATEDPAILHQTTKQTVVQNAEQSHETGTYKKKTFAGGGDPVSPPKGKKARAASRGTSAQRQSSNRAQQQASAQNQSQVQAVTSVSGAQAQAMYKTKGKQSSGLEVPTGSDSKDVTGATPSQAGLQPAAGAANEKAQKNGKEKTAKDQSQGAGQAAATVNVPPTKKQQQDQIIENYQELNKKFTELHMKMNSLQQQVKAQKDLQIQVEQTISKAVKTALPEIVKKQVEDTVAPLMQKQTELFDQQIRTTLVPRIEAQLQRLGGAASSIQAPVGSPQQTAALSAPVAAIPGTAQLTDTQVRKIIHHEFKQAMANQIMPELERELKVMLSKVKEPISSVNKIFYEKLINEEQKSDHMVQEFERRLSFAQQQFQQQQHYSAAPPYAPPHLQQMQQPPLSQSFSIQPQTGQTSFPPQHLPPQPIAIYHSHPHPHYQVHTQMIPQQQQPLINVPQDAGNMIALSQQAPQQQTQQAQIMQAQQPNSAAATAGASPFHTQTSFGTTAATALIQQAPQPQAQTQFQPTAVQAQQQQHPLHSQGSFVLQQQQQPAMTVQQPPQPHQHMVLQQQSSQQLSSPSQQLQPTNSSFVPTVAVQPQHGQQNIQAPTFTPNQATVFHPSNSMQQDSMKQMMNGRNPALSATAPPAFLNQASAEKSGLATFPAQTFAIGAKANAAIASKLPAASDNQDLDVDADANNEAETASENPAAGVQTATNAVEESKIEAAAAEGSSHGAANVSETVPEASAAATEDSMPLPSQNQQLQTEEKSKTE